MQAGKPYECVTFVYSTVNTKHDMLSPDVKKMHQQIWIFERVVIVAYYISLK